eukprot:2552547-Rhodomonas_salina.2
MSFNFPSWTRGRAHGLAGKTIGPLDMPRIARGQRGQLYELYNADSGQPEGHLSGSSIDFIAQHDFAVVRHLKLVGRSWFS